MRTLLSLWNRLRWRHRFLHVSLAVLTGTRLLSAAPGDLDLSFDPPSAWASIGPAFTVVDGQTYYVNSARKLARLREDGSADADWALAIPAQIPWTLVGTAFGGWVVRESTSAFLVQSDQSFGRFAAGVNVVNSIDFPEDDGGVVVDGLSKVSGICGSSPPARCWSGCLPAGCRPMELSSLRLKHHRIWAWQPRDSGRSI